LGPLLNELERGWTRLAPPKGEGGDSGCNLRVTPTKVIRRGRGEEVIEGSGSSAGAGFLVDKTGGDWVGSEG